MSRLILNQENEFCCAVNDFLESADRILLIKCKNTENCKYLLHAIETDSYIMTDLFFNVTQPEQLLFLLRQQQNPNKHPTEYGLFLGYGRESSFFSYGVNPGFIINSLYNAFTSDISRINEQIVNCIKSLGNNITVLLYISDDITNSIKATIDELCSNSELNVKFIFLYKNEIKLNLSNLKLKYEKFTECIELKYTLKQLQPFFPLLTNDQINDLSIATDENIEEMFIIYNQVSKLNNIDSGVFIDALIQTSLGQSCDNSSKKVLGVAAHLFEQFSTDELCDICNNASIDNSYDVIDAVLEENFHKGIIDCTEKEYRFISRNIKKAFAAMYSNISKRLHAAIAKYLAVNKPFEYRLRRLHYRLAEDKMGEINMVAMELCNICHFSKQADYEIFDTFQNIFGEKIKNALLDAYLNISTGNYIAAKNNCLTLCSVDNFVLQAECKYLSALLDWKIGEIQRYPIMKNSLIELINIKELETEIVILAEMLQLSIISNLGEYARTETTLTPYTIFASVNKKLLKYNCSDALFLKHVLYRKSCAAVSRALALKYVSDSFNYFKERKELYFEEYLEAGVNLLAMKIESMDSNNIVPDFNSQSLSENPYIFALNFKSDVEYCKSQQIKMYFTNNYLLSKMFCSQEKVNTAEIELFCKGIDKTSFDSKIMLTMNAGTFYACYEDFDNARRLWAKALELNKGNDDYFEYIIQSNLLICDICEGKVPEHINLRTPALFCNDELYQYMSFRNALIEQIIKDKKTLSYEELVRMYSDKFAVHFSYSNLIFFSTPFLFSDVQFWSDN